MHVPLQGIADFCGRFAEDPHQQAAGGYPDDIGKEIQRVGIAVGGEGSLGIFRECGKGQAGNEKERIQIAVADFYVLVVGAHEPTHNGVCKIHEEMGQFVHRDPQEVFWEFGRFVREVEQCKAQYGYYV